jgi:ankyrin repeat protein
MGLGVVLIPSLSVDGVELREDQIVFDWNCPTKDSPSIIKLAVSAGSVGATITECIETADEDSNFALGPCMPDTVDVDRVAAEEAKVDNQLADPETQKRQAATALPAYNDRAKRLQPSAGTSLPDCVHVSPFVDWNLPDGTPRYGRIAGASGRRVPIGRRNPQLCSGIDDDGCDTAAYVLAGDRVSVAFICGEWSYIKYTPRVRAIPTTIGWVRTSALYGVLSLPAPVQRQTPPGIKDPLERAAFSRDLTQAEALLSGGVDPNGADGLGAPLVSAVENGDAKMVRLLLIHHADPGTGQVAKRALPLLRPIGGDQADIMTMLLAAGADVDARDLDGFTPLLNAIGRNDTAMAELLLRNNADPNLPADVEETQSTSEEGYTPLQQALGVYEETIDPTIIHILLDRGANPDFRGGDVYFHYQRSEYGGETALTIAARKGYLSVVRLLLDHGASPSLKRADGALPANIARKFAFQEIEDLITRAAAREVKPGPAPWTSDGVQLKCDPANEKFEILAYVSPHLGDDGPQEGFQLIRAGTSLHRCKLGARSVVAQIKMTAPAQDGGCMRGGKVEIPSLSVDEVEMEEEKSTLSWSCLNAADPAFVHVTVEITSAGAVFTLCGQTYAPDGTQVDRGCDTRVVDLDK